MKKKFDNSKKSLILLALYAMLFFIPKSSKRKNITSYNQQYKIGYDMPYAYYNDREVYILKDIDKIKDDKGIYIIDERDIDNPRMSVCNSYKIIKLSEIREILKIILKYEEEYASDWDRSIDTMEREWVIHNLCYYLNYETFRTEQVDLDNLDEFNYSSILGVIYTVFEYGNNLVLEKK